MPGAANCGLKVWMTWSYDEFVMSELAEKDCVPCKGGVPPLKGETLADLQRKLGNGWEVINEHHLEKAFTFKNFRDTLAFTNKVGEMAEQLELHPNHWVFKDMRGWNGLASIEAHGEVDQLGPDRFHTRLELKHPALLPWLRVSPGIVDRHFIRHRFGTRAPETFGQMKLVAVRMTDRVQPGFAVESDRVNYQGVAIPMAHRVAEPGRLQIPRMVPVQIDHVKPCVLLE